MKTTDTKNTDIKPTNERIKYLDPRDTLKGLFEKFEHLKELGKIADFNHSFSKEETLKTFKLFLEESVFGSKQYLHLVAGAQIALRFLNLKDGSQKTSSIPQEITVSEELPEQYHKGKPETLNFHFAIPSPDKFAKPTIEEWFWRSGGEKLDCLNFTPFEESMKINDFIINFVESGIDGAIQMATVGCIWELEPHKLKEYLGVLSKFKGLDESILNAIEKVISGINIPSTFPEIKEFKTDCGSIANTPEELKIKEEIKNKFNSKTLISAIIEEIAKDNDIKLSKKTTLAK